LFKKAHVKRKEGNELMLLGAVITAAGMSSRMGNFKPLLNIGSISVSQRIITTLKQAGTEVVVVVTGFHADELEHHLAQNQVMFLRNDYPESTEMFDSAVIGLKYLYPQCSRILFSPVDVPLFTTDTIKELLITPGDIIVPTYEGQPGHPILISSTVAQKVCHMNNAPGGLCKTLQQCGHISYVEVPDKGILHDMDTPEDFEALLAYHNHQILRPVVDIKLAGENYFFDSRIAMLLFLINYTHSMLSACKQMQISYSSGWKLINNSEKELGFPLVNRWQGGTKGGRTTLTAEGFDLLTRYKNFSIELQKKAAELFITYFDSIFKQK
jgi:molybdate transport repressor ModE-like protein